MEEVNQTDIKIACVCVCGGGGGGGGCLGGVCFGFELGGSVVVLPFRSFVFVVLADLVEVVHFFPFFPTHSWNNWVFFFFFFFFLVALRPSKIQSASRERFMCRTDVS